jgi:hypothetical protein
VRLSERLQDDEIGKVLRAHQAGELACHDAVNLAALYRFEQFLHLGSLQDFCA